MLELDVSCFNSAEARINGDVPIGCKSSSFLSWTKQNNLQVSYQLGSCEFSNSRMVQSCPGMREAGILFYPIGRSFTRGAPLTCGFRQTGASRGGLMGWSDNERISEARLDSGVLVPQDSGQAYARLRPRAALKETNNDPWESRSEVTELDTRAASFDMRGRETSLDDSKLNFEFEIGAEGIAKGAEGVAGSRRSIESDSFDNRNSTLGRNTQETHLRKGERAAGTDGMSPLDFRNGGKTADFGALATFKDDGTDGSRIDLRYGRQVFKEQDLYEEGEGREQIDATQILMDPEKQNVKYVPGGIKEILHWRDQEEGLESSRKKLVEGDNREVFVSDKQKAMKATAGIADNRRMLKRSKMIAKQIISQSSAMALGFVSQMWVNTVLWQVNVLEVKSSLLSGEVEGVLVNDVCQVGDVILVSDESALENELNVLESETLVGYELVTEDGYSLGKVRDYSFTLLDGKVTSLEFDSLGISLVPSNLISTYWLGINEVMAVSSDSLRLKRGAESRARRLTKGILQLPRLQGRPQSQRLVGNQRRKSVSQEISYKGKQMPSQTKQLPSRGSVGLLEESELDGLDRNTDLGDRWSPMDYGSSRRKT